MQNEESRYEVKPMLALVPYGTPAWCGKFVQAFRHVGPKVILAIIAGLAFTTASAFWHPAPNETAFWPNFGGHLLTELAIAFFVSAIVMFAFEWGSEVKHSLDLAGKLANALTAHIDQILKASAAEAVANAMSKLAGRSGEQFSRQFLTLSRSIESLDDSGWTARGFLEFMHWYHGEFTRYAESLSHLSDRVSQDPKSKDEFRLVLPKATTPIDVMLADLTNEMKHNGTYYAISDIFTWTKLTDYHAAQTKHLRAGLKIRRIFIVGKTSDTDIPAKAVSEHMYGHLEEAVRSRCNYRIKLTSEADFERLAAPILTETEHFGIFKPTDPEKLPIIVQVLDAQLLTFRIAGAAEAEAVLVEFKKLWQRLRDVIPDCDPNDPEIDDPDWGDADHRGTGTDPSPGTQPNGDAIDPEATREGGTAKAIIPTETPSATDIIRDHVMAYRLRQLLRSRSNSVWYHGASRIDLWTRGAVQEFEQAVAEAAEAGVEIMRLFIFEWTKHPDERKQLDERKPDKVFLTLRKHAEISRKYPNYQWRVLDQENIQGNLLNTPFALFHDGKTVEVEVARGNDDKFAFGATKILTTELEEGFKELWKHAAEPSESDTYTVKLLTRLRAVSSRRSDPDDDEIDPDEPDLPESIRNELLVHLTQLTDELRDELKNSIRALFPENGQAVIDFISPQPSQERSDNNQEPQKNK